MQENATRLVSVFLSAATVLLPGVLQARSPDGSQHATQPNILLITADNLGYGDLKLLNRESTVNSRHLERLASEGILLRSFYTASPTCTVSRASLLTGRIPQRHGLVDQLPGIEGNYGIGLRHSELLLPQVLRAAGYRTGCFGKWNIGFARGSRPTERGFDEFIGHASGNMDYFEHRYNGKHDLYRGTDEFHVPGQYSTDLFADAAIRFLSDDTDAPWFCYLPFNAPHFPNKKNKRPGQPNIWQATEQAFAEYGWNSGEKAPYKRYCAVITALDMAIGRVLDALEQTDQADNTFVFFYSDNGAFRLGRPVDIGSNEPLRSGGVTCYEGGLRVVALARWPDKIPAGSESNAMLWSPDLFATCCQLAGTAAPANRTLDGENLLPNLVEPAQATPHRSLYFEYRQHAALRLGNWKIVREGSTRWQLYNVKDDLPESHDLASARGDIVRKLEQEFNSWQSRAGAP